MAEIKSITALLQVRVNTGQYEGTEALVSMTANLDDFDDAAEEHAKLQRQVDEAMLLQLRAIYKGRGKSTSAKMIAKQHGIPMHGGEG